MIHVTLRLFNNTFFLLDISSSFYVLYAMYEFISVSSIQASLARKRASNIVVSAILLGSFLIFYEARHRHFAAVSCRFGPCEKQLNVAEFIFGSLNLIPVLPRASRRRKRTGTTLGAERRRVETERTAAVKRRIFCFSPLSCSRWSF